MIRHGGVLREKNRSRHKLRHVLKLKNSSQSVGLIFFTIIELVEGGVNATTAHHPAIEPGRVVFSLTRR